MIGAGLVLAARKGYRALMLHGVSDHRFAPASSLPEDTQPPVLFSTLRDGESVLGRGIRLPLPERKDIAVELGFVSILGGRDLRLRTGGRTFRAMDEWEDRPASTFIFDIIRHDRNYLRAFSAYGSALLEVTRAAEIAQRLAHSRERTVTIDNIPLEVRGLVSQHLTGDVHFERVEE